MALSATPVVDVEFDTGVWTSVIADVRSVSGKRGRSTEMDQFSAGRATVVLANADRKYDPEHAAGTYFGKLLPRKRIRIGFTYSGTTYWKFYGYVDGWPQSYDGPTDSTVTVRATDAFKVLARAQVPSVWDVEVEADSPHSRYGFGEQSGTSLADSAGKAHGTYAGGATFNSRTGLVANDSDNAIELDGADDVATIPSAGVPNLSDPYQLGVDFTVEFWISGEAPAATAHILGEGNTSGALLVTVNTVGILTAEGVDGFASVTSPSSVMTGQAKHIAIVGEATVELRLYVNGTLVDTSVSGAPTMAKVPWTAGDTAGASFTIDEVTTYTTALSAARVLAHYNAGTAPWEGDTPKTRIDRVLDYIGWPAADRDIDTGRAILIPAKLETNALGHLQAVELSEGGRLFIDRTGRVALIGRSNFWTEAAYKTSNATFGDSGSELKYQAKSGDLFGFDDTKIVNEARVRQSGGSEQVATDAASQTAYGLMSRSETSLEQRPGVVRNRAEYLVNKEKDPALRMPQVQIKPERDPAGLYALLGANDIGYRYTFTRRPQNVGSAISKEFHVEGESFKMTPADITFEWELSPAEPAVWIWGTSTWGSAKWSY